MRMYDELGYVVPHCQLCMDEIKLGETLIMTELYYLVHERCEDQNKHGEMDRGEFSELVGRNFAFFPSFVQQFNEMGVYKKQ